MTKTGKPDWKGAPAVAKMPIPTSKAIINPRVQRGTKRPSGNRYKKPTVEPNPIAHSRARGKCHNGWAAVSINGDGEKTAEIVTNMIAVNCAIQSFDRRQKMRRATPKLTSLDAASNRVWYHAPLRDACSCTAL